jgi:hypothetical protein
MSDYSLPREGRTPDPIAAGQRAKKVMAPEPEPPSTMPLKQYVIVRQLKTGAGGFMHECKKLGNAKGRRTLAEWDELLTAYRNRPIRG